VDDAPDAGLGSRLENDLGPSVIGFQETVLLRRPEVRVRSQMVYVFNARHGRANKGRIEDGALHKFGASIEAGRAL
jgi:hypothetical protein